VLKKRLKEKYRFKVKRYMKNADLKNRSKKGNKNQERFLKQNC